GRRGGWGGGGRGGGGFQRPGGRTGGRRGDGGGRRRGGWGGGRRGGGEFHRCGGWSGGRCRDEGGHRRGGWSGGRRGGGGFHPCGGLCRHLEIERDRLVRLAEREGDGPLEVDDDAHGSRVELRSADAEHGPGTRDHVGQCCAERRAAQVDVDARGSVGPGGDPVGRRLRGRREVESHSRRLVPRYVDPVEHGRGQR